VGKERQKGGKESEKKRKEKGGAMDRVGKIWRGREGLREYVGDWGAQQREKSCGT